MPDSKQIQQLWDALVSIGEESIAKQWLEKFKREQQERAAMQATRPRKPPMEHNMASESEYEDGTGATKKKKTYMKEKEKNKGMGDKVLRADELGSAYSGNRLRGGYHGFQ